MEEGKETNSPSRPSVRLSTSPARVTYRFPRKVYWSWELRLSDEWGEGVSRRVSTSSVELGQRENGGHRRWSAQSWG